jgi:hypothetical protein
MEPEKNLHANIPSALVADMERAAEAEHITVDELVRDALEYRLNRREWQDVVAFREKHARSCGLPEADVPEAISEVRREASERRR